MNSETSRSIQKRKKANDVFYTPEEVVNLHVEMIDSQEGDLWLDPFYGKGAYYDAFPTESKSWTEIAKGRDFFAYREPCDIICSNPPYSIMDRVLEHSVALSPRCISYLIGQHNLTTKRIEYMNSKGYGLKALHLLKIYEWYGMSCIVVFEKGATNCISFSRKVYHVSSEESAT